jgi:hypothetical protein
MVSGNRNDPLDLGYNSKNGLPYKATPTQHRVTVVFDRQDSLDLGLDSNGITNSDLLAVTSSTTSATVTPGNASYFLSNGKYGYYMDFVSPRTSSFTSKGIVPPTVLAGVLFYSFFTPMTADPCLGGTGYSYTRRTCNVMSPEYTNSTAVLGCTSGQVIEWWGVASNLASKSVIAVIQAGNVSVTDPNGSVVQQLTTQTFGAKVSGKYAQPRTWRSVPVQ